MLFVYLFRLFVDLFLIIFSGIDDILRIYLSSHMDDYEDYCSFVEFCRENSEFSHYSGLSCNDVAGSNYYILDSYLFSSSVVTQFLYFVRNFQHCLFVGFSQNFYLDAELIRCCGKILNLAGFV